jgi:hypothetical protein
MHILIKMQLIMIRILTELIKISRGMRRFRNELMLNYVYISFPDELKKSKFA